MAKPPLNGVAETEYTKSQQRERSPLFENSSRLHAAERGLLIGKSLFK